MRPGGDARRRVAGPREGAEAETGAGGRERTVPARAVGETDRRTTFQILGGAVSWHRKLLVM